MDRLVTRAPAKVNLTLRVLGRRGDGFHDLASLVVFAGAGDLLSLAPDAPLGLDVRGPTAAAAGEGADNLVLKAARAFLDRVPGARAGRFTLVKRLPVAAGLGGGSSDAAGALRLLAELNGLPADDPRVHDAARSTGSDVPVCLDPRGRFMGGVGDALSPPLGLPPLAAVLVNPGVAVPTADVFRALGLRAGDPLLGPDHPESYPTEPSALLSLLAELPNDLEPPADALTPVIGQVRAALRAAPEARLVRMSGSGASVFALVDDCRKAAALARRIGAQHPSWWVRPTLLR